MAAYRGKIVDDRNEVTIDGQPLDPRHDLMNHSPDGFNWGYHGSGPAQLALALLADHFLRQVEDGETADLMALKIYQSFKHELIATLPQDCEWALQDFVIEDTVRLITRKEGLKWFRESCKTHVRLKEVEEELAEAYQSIEDLEEMLAKERNRGD